MRLLDGCKKLVYIVLFAVLLPVTAYVWYGAMDTLKYADSLQKILHGKSVPIFLLGTSFLLGIFLVGILRKSVPFLESRGKGAVAVLWVFMLFLQIFMVLTVRTSLRYDHLKIFDTAVALLDEKNAVIADTHFKYYFMKYPNNIPLCLFTYVWLKAAAFFGLPQGCFMEFVKLLNILFMNAGLWCAYRLVCRYRSRRTGIVFLCLVLFHPLWYLLGQMYYTSTVSLAFSMGGIQLYDDAKREKRLWKKYLGYLCMGIVLAAGYKIRATVILTMAALLVYAFLQLENLRSSREAFSLLAVLAGIALALAGYGKIEARYAGFDPKETGYPTVHWIMMSAQGEGQYNSADDAYTGSFSTREERIKADVALLKERLQNMGAGGLFTLFRNKLRVAFSDGTDDYYSLFQTMRKTSRLQKYINGSRSDYLAVYLHGYHVFLMGLSLFALIWRIFQGKRNFLDIISVNLCGAYLFYFIWEVDSAYSIPFMLMFLIWAADGMEQVQNFWERRVQGRGNYVPAAAGVGLAALACFLVLAVRRNGQPVQEYLVLQDQETSGDFLLQTEFRQTFRTGKPFDHLAVWVANWDGAANDSVYDVAVMDEEGRTVAAGEVVGAAAPCMSDYTIVFAPVQPDREQIYMVQVTLRNPDCAIKTDFLYYGSGSWDMYPDGMLHASEAEENMDLAFAVYEERN